MDRNEIEAFVQEIMLDFASQTGLMSNDAHPRRYLWTDAFAVCNYIVLFRRTRNETWNRKINIVMLATSLAPNRFVMT